MSEVHIAAYISDHLEELEGLGEMLDYLGQKENTIEHHRFFQRIKLEILQDQKVLQRLLDELREEESEIRQLRGRLPEKAGRGFGEKRDMDPGTLGFFEALEFLVLGIQGTSLLWRVLASVASKVGAWKGTDFKGLEKRAKSQRDRVETVRMDVASEVLLGH